jgi:hypothetical protein
MVDSNDTRRSKVFIARATCGTGLHLTDLVCAGTMRRAALYHLQAFLDDVRECGIEPSEVCVTVRPLAMPSMQTTDEVYIETFVTAY